MPTDDVRGLVRQQQARMEAVLRLFERAAPTARGEE